MLGPTFYSYHQDEKIITILGDHFKNDDGSDAEVFLNGIFIKNVEVANQLIMLNSSNINAGAYMIQVKTQIDYQESQIFSI